MRSKKGETPVKEIIEEYGGVVCFTLAGTALIKGLVEGMKYMKSCGLF